MQQGWIDGSDNAEWGTPQALYDGLNVEFAFTLDPCATDKNHKCKKYFTKEQDGLKQSWDGETVFLNLPYANIYPWIEKAYNTNTHIIVALLPARTETKWFHDFIYNRAEIRFLRHRLKYNDGKTAAPFGSMIVIWRK